MVWVALIASMTVVGGGLWVADGAKAAQADPLMAVDRASDPTAKHLRASTVDDGFVRGVLTVSPGVKASGWKAIVIHDSGGHGATPATLDERARSMGLRGLGYHYLIGNGAGMADGEVHVSDRWLSQAPGAHAAGPDADWYNRNAIGICLVGDGDRARFSAMQNQQLSRLVRALCARHKIAPDHVYLHSQIAPTTSPGKYFAEAQFRAGL